VKNDLSCSRLQIRRLYAWRHFVHGRYILVRARNFKINPWSGLIIRELVVRTVLKHVIIGFGQIRSNPIDCYLYFLSSILLVNKSINKVTYFNLVSKSPSVILQKVFMSLRGVIRIHFFSLKENFDIFKLLSQKPYWCLGRAFARCNLFICILLHNCPFAERSIKGFFITSQNYV